MKMGNSEVVPPPQANPEMDGSPDLIVILAALCCALVGAIGLMMVRPSWLCHLFGSATSAAPAPPGLRRGALKLLPSVRYSSSRFLDDTECPICLTELSEGELMRVLPLCGHVFHVNCIDTWLGCRSSCPSCRQVVVQECRSCTHSQRRPPGSCHAIAASAELALVV